MEFDQIDYSSMPTDRDSAFIHVESQLREAYEVEARRERERHTDQDGNYVGIFEAERTYVSGVLALLDELGVDIDVADITNFSMDDGAEFYKKFMSFRQKIGRTIYRFKIRNARMESANAGTVMQIQDNYKVEIGKLLVTIRKIVNQEVGDVNKKDKIFRKISSLQSEVDRDLTTADMLFRRMVELSETVGECVENLEPLVEKIERLGGMLAGGSKRVQELPDRGRTKLIEDHSDKESQFGDLDNDIPF